MSESTTTNASVEPMLTLIRELDYPYFPGGIFPSEMALFLYQCERARVDWIIESGRQDGYSTAGVAAYAKLRGIRADSIDFEADPARARSCRERLARLGGVTLHAGNAFHMMPAILRSGTGRIALLVDGPKCHDAVTLSSAAVATQSVVLVAHHNTAPETEWYPRFVAAFGPAHRVETSPIVQSPRFAAFREWERGVAAKTERDLDHTSIAVSVLSEPGPRTAPLWQGEAAHRAQALSTYLSWKVRGDRMAVGLQQARRAAGRALRGLRG